MKAIIPVAGIGTRLQPLTNKVPKVLINVAGKPMLFHLIDELEKTGQIDKVVLIIGYLGDQVIEAVKEHYAVSKLSFEFVEQKEMLGLGHAVYHGKDLVADESLLIVLGDTVFEFDLPLMLASEYSAIGYKDVYDVRRYGIIESNGGFITRMIEKPSGPEVTPSKSAIAGVYFIKSGKRLFDAISYLFDSNIRTKNEYQLTDALQKMITDGEKFVPFEIQNWFDCGKPETLLSTNSYLLKRDHSKTIDLRTVDIKITPPVFLGANCELSNCEIGPFVTLASGVKVKNSVIQNSLICEDAEVEEAELDEVILGKGEFINGIHNRNVKADSKEMNF